ncbi:MAG: class I SAM-dependent methyltransferase [Patescibacteria group bacterium]|jgi:ubiquinone/menaquinone biosynthesis C-methylase UbiE
MKQVDQKEYDKEYFTTDGGCGSAEVWETYKGKKVDKRLQKSVKLAQIRSGERILDYGCGRGEMLVQSAQHGAYIWGIDYASDAISLAEEARSACDMETQSRIKIALQTSKILPFSDNTFDMVYFLDVIEHLYQEEVDQALTEIFRVLKPGGRIILHTYPNKKYFEIGYKYYTKHIYHILSKILFEPFLKRKIRYDDDPRIPYDKIMHVNEQTLASVKSNLVRAKFVINKAYLSDLFLLKSPIGIFRYLLLTPSLLPFLKDIFANNIWAVGIKK